MSLRLQKYVQQHLDNPPISYTTAQLEALHRDAAEQATEARLTALESRMLDADIEEVQCTLATLEALQGCLAAVQAHPDTATLLAIQRTVNLQHEHLGFAPITPATEAFSDGDLTASLESGIWDTIKRLWAAVLEMCKRVIQYVINLFNGNAAKQKAYTAEVEAGRKEFEESLRDYVAKQKGEPAAEDYAGVLDVGMLVSASAFIKDALNIAPREGKIDLKGLMGDGIVDIRTLTQLKDKLFRGLQVLEQFQRGEQAALEAAINAYMAGVYQDPLAGFRGPKDENKTVHYHSRWVHPLGGVMLVVTPPPEGSKPPDGAKWAANVVFQRVVDSIEVKPYRSESVADDEGAPLRMNKQDILRFFEEVRTFAKAAAGYNAVYKTLFESFNSRQVTAAKPYADAVGGDTAAYQRNQNACAFATQLVRLAQRYAQLAQQTSKNHTQVLAAAAQLNRNIAAKITKKKEA